MFNVVKQNQGFNVAMKVSKADLDDFYKRLESLTPSLRREVERKVITAAGSGYKSHLKKETPQSRKTGSSSKWSRTTKIARGGQRDALRRSIVVKKSTKWDNPNKWRKAGVIGATVGHAYRNNPVIGPHAHLVNAGHRAYYWSDTDSGQRVRGSGYLTKARNTGTQAAAAKMKAKSAEALQVAIRKAASK
jgi:hypothetical protein